MLVIKSSNNLIYKKIKQQISKYTQYKDEFFVEGSRACSLFKTSPYYELVSWYIKRSQFETFYNFTDEKFLLFDDPLFNTLSNLQTPSGLIGHFKKKEEDNIIQTFSYPTFVLNNICDPGNLGTIIRTAVALNRKEIILLDGVYPNLYKVIQASAGTIAHINVIKTTVEEFLEKKLKDLPLYGLDASGENYESIDSSEFNNCFLLIGNEAHGIDERLKKNMDRFISIPMSDMCESLNAAIAASIVGYRCWKVK